MISLITAIPFFVKAAPFIWSVLIAVVGVGGSLFVASKITEERIDYMKNEINELKEESKELRINQAVSEKEIAKTLKNIEIKLGELATTVSLYMLQNKDNHNHNHNH